MCTVAVPLEKSWFGTLPFPMGMLNWVILVIKIVFFWTYDGFFHCPRWLGPMLLIFHEPIKVWFCKAFGGEGVFRSFIACSLRFIGLILVFMHLFSYDGMAVWMKFEEMLLDAWGNSGIMFSIISACRILGLIIPIAVESADQSGCWSFIDGIVFFVEIFELGKNFASNSSLIGVFLPCLWSSMCSKMFVHEAFLHKKWTIDKSYIKQLSIWSMNYEDVP